jgi:hypothetical protein
MSNFCPRCGTAASEDNAKNCVSCGKFLGGSSETKKNDSFNDSKEKLFNFAKNVKDLSIKASEDLRSDETKTKIKNFANQAQSFASEKTKDFKDELGKINEARKASANDTKNFETTSKLGNSKAFALSFWAKLSLKQKLIFIGLPLFLSVCLVALFENKYSVKDASAELSKYQTEVCKLEATFINFENKRLSGQFSSLQEANAFVKNGTDRFIAQQEKFIKSPVTSWAKKNAKNEDYLQCMMSKDILPCDTRQRPMPNLNEASNACNGLFWDIVAIERN